MTRLDKLLRNAEEDGWSREEAEILLSVLGSEEEAGGWEEEKSTLRKGLFPAAWFAMGVLVGVVTSWLVKIL